MPGAPRASTVLARVLAACAALAAALILPGCQSNRAESARQLMQQQEEEQALARLQEDSSGQRAASRPQVALSLIRKEQEAGRYFASLAYLDAYRQTFGEVPEAQAMRADALRKTGQAQASEQAYRALTGGPQAAQAWHGLGLLAGADGHFDQAADYLHRAVQQRPTDPQYLSDLGYALLRAGSPREARVPLGQAAELAPDNAKILGNLAVLLLVEGNTAGARQVMERAGLSPEARSQVQQMAAQCRADMAPAVAAAAPVSPGASRPVVRAVAASSGATASTDRRDGMAMPMLSRQGPLMDRFGNPPALQ